MTKEKRGSEPELKLWDSPGTTKKYTKNRKTGQLDLLWGEERPLFDDWDNRMEQKTARARDCQSYSDLAVRRSSATQYEPSIRRRAAVQYEAPARRRPVSPAANRKRSCRRRTRLQKELQSIALYIAALLFLVLAAFAVWKFVSISKNQSTETGAISRITQILEQKKCEKPPMEEAFLTPNPYSRPQDALSTVTQLYVHYTANPGTSARQNRDYFEGLAQTGLASASAHFVIGYEGEIVQCIPLNEMAYAVIGENDHSISIECCYLDQDGKFTDATYQSLLKLLGWLMEEYNLDVSDVKRHYDAGGKLCPLYYAEHEDAWEQLKQDLSDYISGEKSKKRFSMKTVCAKINATKKSHRHNSG